MGQRGRNHGKDIWISDDGFGDYHGGNRSAESDSKKPQGEEMRPQFSDGAVATQRLHVQDLLRSANKVLVHSGSGFSWGDFLYCSLGTVLFLQEQAMTSKRNEFFKPFKEVATQPGRYLFYVSKLILFLRFLFLASVFLFAGFGSRNIMV